MRRLALVLWVLIPLASSAQDAAPLSGWRVPPPPGAKGERTKLSATSPARLDASCAKLAGARDWRGLAALLAKRSREPSLRTTLIRGSRYRFVSHFTAGGTPPLTATPH